MAVDFDAYIKKNTFDGQGVDFDAYLAKHEPKKEGRAAQAGLEAYGNTATLGHLPQAQAMAEPITDQLFSAMTTGWPTNNGAPARQMLGIGPEYVEARDKNIQRGKELEAAHPTASKVGTGAGIVATALVPGGSVAKSVGALPKGASLLKKVITAAKSGAKTGAIYGAAANPGDTEGEIDPLQVGDRAENSAIGATIGGVLSGGLQAAGPLAQKAAAYFGSKAETKAVKAAGADKAALKLLKKEGRDKPLGRTLLDEKLVTPFASTKKVVERVKDRIEPTEEKLVALISDAESKIGKTEFWDSLPLDQQEKIFQSLFRPKETAERLKSEIIEKYKQIPRAKIQPMLDEIDVWFAKRGEVMSPAENQAAKVQMNRFLKDTDFSREVGPVKEGTITARRGFRQGVENTADTLAEVMGEKGGQIKSTNKTLGDLYTLEKIGENRIAGIDANRSVSLTDYLTATATGNLGGPAAAVAGAGVNKLGRTFGNSLQAKGYDAISKGLKRTPVVTAFAQQHPTTYLTLINAIGGGPEYKEGNTEILQDDKILGIFRSNPALLDSVTDTKLREKLKSAINRDPADSAMKRRLSK